MYYIQEVYYIQPAQYWIFRYCMGHSGSNICAAGQTPYRKIFFPILLRLSTPQDAHNLLTLNERAPLFRIVSFVGKWGEKRSAFIQAFPSMNDINVKRQILNARSCDRQILRQRLTPRTLNGYTLEYSG